MLWYGQSNDCSRFGHHNVAPALAGQLGNQDAQRPELLRGAAVPEWQALHRHFNFAGGDGQWQTLLDSNGKTLSNRILNVRFRFDFCSSLAQTSGNGRALGYEHAIFVLLDGDGELHIPIILGVE